MITIISCHSSLVFITKPCLAIYLTTRSDFNSRLCLPFRIFSIASSGHFDFNAAQGGLGTNVLSWPLFPRLLVLLLLFCCLQLAIDNYAVMKLCFDHQNYSQRET